jgi:hypothetical protein
MIIKMSTKKGRYTVAFTVNGKNYLNNLFIKLLTSFPNQ